MKRFTKKGISIVLVMALCFTSITFPTKEAKAEVSIINNIIWSYSIDANGNAINVYTISDFKQGGSSEATTVSIPEKLDGHNVVSIGKNNVMGDSSVFLGSTNTIKTVDLSKATYLTKINDYAFNYRSTISSIILPENIESVGANAFKGCSSMNVSIYNPNITLDDNCCITDVNKVSSYEYSTTADYFNTNKMEKTKWDSSIYYEKSFQVKVDKNGGSLASGVYSDNYYGVEGKELSNLKSYATRDHYVLDGYYSSTAEKEFDEKYYSFEASNKSLSIATEGKTFGSIDSSILTLKAKWIPDNYYVQFNANTGIGSMENQTFGYDVSEKINKNTFVKDGYTFKNWNSSADGYGNSFENQQEVTNLTQAKDGIYKLYAQWTPNVYKVYYDNNGGSGSMDIQSMVYDTSYSLKTNSFVKVGYVCNGWNTKADGTGHAYVDGQTVLNLVKSGSITLYAQWGPRPDTIYKIECVYKGIDGSEDEVKSHFYQGVSDTEVSVEPSQYAKTGFVTPLTRTIKINADGSSKLTYTYERQEYSLRVLNETDRRIKSISGVKKYSYGQAVTCEYTTNQGASPNGWEIPDGLVTSSSSNAIHFFMPANDVELQVSILDHEYQLTLELNDGTLNDERFLVKGDKATMATKMNDTILLPKDVKRSNYHFIGWTMKESNQPIDSVKQDVDENLVCVASWEKDQYTIHFDLDGGTCAKGELADLNLSAMDAFMIPKSYVTKPGFYLAGWYCKETKTTYSEEEYNNPIDVTHNATVTLVARWNVIDSSVNPDVEYVATDSKYQGIDSTADEKRQGYYFNELTEEQKNLYRGFVQYYKDNMHADVDTRVFKAFIRSDSSKDLFVENINQAIDAFYYDHPEVFWFRGGSVSYCFLEDGYNFMFVPTLAYATAPSDISKYEKALELFKTSKNYCLCKITSDMDNYTKYQYINQAVVDWITDYTTELYDATGTNDTRTAGSALLYKLCCCEGYAKLYKVLCDEYGLSCVLVNNKTHMWNEINLEGKWYAVDTCWNDSSSKNDYFAIGFKRLEELDGSGSHTLSVGKMNFPELSQTSFGESNPFVTASPAPKSQLIVQQTVVHKKTQNAPQVNSSTVKKGTTFIAGNVKYLVTDARKKEVRVKGLKTKKIRSITIPNKVKYQNKWFKITSVDKHCFDKAKKLKKVVMNCNVKTNPNKLFYKLKKNCVLQVSKKYYKKYKAQITKLVAKKKMKIKVK